MAAFGQGSGSQGETLCGGGGEGLNGDGWWVGGGEPVRGRATDKSASKSLGRNIKPMQLMAGLRVALLSMNLNVAIQRAWHGR